MSTQKLIDRARTMRTANLMKAHHGLLLTIAGMSAIPKAQDERQKDIDCWLTLGRIITKGMRAEGVAEDLILDKGREIIRAIEQACSRWGVSMNDLARMIGDASFNNLRLM